MEGKTGDRQPVPKQQYNRDITRVATKQHESGKSEGMRYLVRQWEYNIGT